MFHVEHTHLHTSRHGLYVHVPFCKNKCSYCDFYRIVDLSLLQQFVTSAIKELHAVADDYKNNNNGIPLRLTTVYLGGGTPSILGPHYLNLILSTINNLFDLSSLEEFTVECNPEDVSDSLVDVLINNGVNRVSLGVQSLDDHMLHFLCRRHSADKVYDTINLLHHKGIHNISVDIIFGLPYVQNFDFKQDISRFLSLDVKHISAYALSYEQGSMLTRLVEMGKVVPLNDDAVADQYALLSHSLINAGFQHYEISNYSKPGFHSRHNTDCWHRVPYIGIGPGASSFDGLSRWTNTPDVRDYINSPSVTDKEILSPLDVYNEVVMLGLRTRQGVNIVDIPLQYLDDFRRLASSLIADNMLVASADGYYSIPASSWFLLDLLTEKMML